MVTPRTRRVSLAEQGTPQERMERVEGAEGASAHPVGWVVSGRGPEEIRGGRRGATTSRSEQVVPADRGDRGGRGGSLRAMGAEMGGAVMAVHRGVRGRKALRIWQRSDPIYRTRHRSFGRSRAQGGWAVGPAAAVVVVEAEGRVGQAGTAVGTGARAAERGTGIKRREGLSEK